MISSSRRGIRSEALALPFEAVRSGDLTEQEALARHEWVTEAKMRLLNNRVSRGTAWAIGRGQGWVSTYDAEYPAITSPQADALVAVEPGLVAKVEGAVPVAPYEALIAPGR